ncbi:MAG TPA: P27 family phage terminase small subunit [Acholeplasmataceae bacterium]|nr:P27 family phage terminase small subunit [Acholeplasmataceae bacterium]
MSKKEIKNSLIEQLAMLGATAEHYIDLINDYMGLWDVKTALMADIKKRGVTYKDFSSVGIEMQKNNPSVKELVMVNRQMLSILKELGLSTANLGGVDDGEEM